MSVRAVGMMPSKTSRVKRPGRRAAPLWKAYERQVLSDLTRRYRGLADVTYNEQGRQRLLGQFSGIMRQIDVLVRGRIAYDLPNATLVVDCKLRKRPITVEGVEAFAGLVDDVGADAGLLVASAGYSKPALRRAVGFTGMRLEVVQLDELAQWLRLRPTIAVTTGASTGTFTYHEDDAVTRSDTAPIAVVHGVLHAPSERRHSPQ